MEQAFKVVNYSTDKYEGKPEMMFWDIRLMAKEPHTATNQWFDFMSSNSERLLSKMSKDKIWYEFNKSVEVKNFDYFIHILFCSGILHYLFPEVCKLHHIFEKPPMKNGSKCPCAGPMDTLTHTLTAIQFVEEVGCSEYAMKMAILFHDVEKGSNIPAQVIDNNKFITKFVTDEIRDYVKLFMRFSKSLKLVNTMPVDRLLDVIYDVTGFESVNQAKLVDLITLTKCEIMAKVTETGKTAKEQYGTPPFWIEDAEKRIMNVFLECVSYCMDVSGYKPFEYASHLQVIKAGIITVLPPNLLKTSK